MESKELQEMLHKKQQEHEEGLFKGQGRASITRRSKNEDLVIDSVDLVHYYNTHISPLDNIFKPMASKAGICPFHNDTDPSFHANQKNKYYHCFGCGFGGNIIKVHRQIQNNYHKRTISKKEAILELAVLYDLKLFPEEESESKDDKFALAKYILTNPDYIKEYTGSVTLSQYEKNNRNILKSGLSFEQIREQLGELDLLLTVYLEED